MRPIFYGGISQTYFDHGNQYSETHFLRNTNSQGIQNVSPANPSTPELVLKSENIMPIHCLRTYSIAERKKVKIVSRCVSVRVFLEETSI